MNYLKLRKINKLYFGYGDIARALGITMESARVSAARFTKKGFLVRLKRNLYVLEERWAGLEKEDFFSLANLMQVPSYISLMTAMDYYGITTQIQREFFESIAIKGTKEFEIKGSIFNYTKIDGGLYFGFTKAKSFFIATAEKAFLDALYLMSLKRYKFDMTSIDFNKLNKEEMSRTVKKFPKKTKNLLERYGYFKKT